MTRVIGALVMLLIANPMKSHAQEKPAQLEEVVVTATKIETPVAETGASVTAIPREEIQRRQAMDALEILRDVPGISLVQTGSRGGTTSIFTRGGNNDMNLVLIDGVKVNAAGGFYDFADLATTGIERIEIIRGPQSALYGADAMSSVIQIITPRGRGPLSIRSSALAGNYDTTEERLSLSWGTDRVGLSFALGRIDTTGILDTNNEYRNTTVSLRVDLSPDRDLEFTLTGRFSESRFEFPTESAGDRLQTFLDPHQFQERERLVTGTTARHQVASWWEHRFMVGLALEDRINRDERNPQTDTTFRRTTTKEERISLDYHSTFFLPVFAAIAPVATVGAAFEPENFTQRVVTSTGTRTNKDRRNAGVYGQLQLGWLERVFFTGGLRYDESSAYGEALNPRVSVAVILPLTETRLRGAYGTGIKAPSFSAEFGGATFPGNPNIQAEKSLSWEAGFDQPLWGRALEIGATYFNNRYEDLIAFVSNAVGFDNIQSAKTQGLEVTLAGRPMPGLTVKAGYTYLETEVLNDGGVGGTAFPKGGELLRRPMHSGSASMAYEVDRLATSLSLFHKGNSVDRDFRFPSGRRQTLDGYTKVDLAGSYLLARNWMGLGELRWNMKVENLLNQEYEEVLGFSSPRLKFLTGLEARY